MMVGRARQRRKLSGAHASRPPQAVEAAAQEGCGHGEEHKHRLRNRLWEIFALPAIMLGIPCVGGPTPPVEAAASSTVQIMTTGTQSAAETQRLDALIRSRQSGSADPENATGKTWIAGEPVAFRFPHLTLSGQTLTFERSAALVKEHLAARADPETAKSGEHLVQAIETIADLQEKTLDHDDAVRAVIECYAELERKRGKKDEEITASVRRVREWLELQ